MSVPGRGSEFPDIDIGFWEGLVFPDVMASMWQFGVLASGGNEAPKGFMDSLPDPMKLDAGTLIFVMCW